MSYETDGMKPVAWCERCGRLCLDIEAAFGNLGWAISVRGAPRAICPRCQSIPAERRAGSASPVSDGHGRLRTAEDRLQGEPGDDR